MTELTLSLVDPSGTVIKRFKSTQGSIELGRGSKTSDCSKLHCGLFRGTTSAVMSYKQALISFDQDEYAFIQDCDSTNGTFLKDDLQDDDLKRLKPHTRYRLKHGSQVRFGRAVGRKDGTICHPLMLTVHLTKTDSSTLIRRDLPLDSDPTSDQLDDHMAVTQKQLQSSQQDDNKGDVVNDNLIPAQHHRRHTPRRTSGYGLTESDLIDQDQLDDDDMLDIDDDMIVLEPVNTRSNVMTTTSNLSLDVLDLTHDKEQLKPITTEPLKQTSTSPSSSSHLTFDIVIFDESPQKFQHDSKMSKSSSSKSTIHLREQRQVDIDHDRPINLDQISSTMSQFDPTFHKDTKQVDLQEQTNDAGTNLIPCSQQSLSSSSLKDLNQIQLDETKLNFIEKTLTCFDDDKISLNDDELEDDIVNDGFDRHHSDSQDPETRQSIEFNQEDNISSSFEIDHDTTDDVCQDCQNETCSCFDGESLSSHDDSSHDSTDQDNQYNHQIEKSQHEQECDCQNCQDEDECYCSEYGSRICYQIAKKPCKRFWKAAFGHKLESVSDMDSETDSDSDSSNLESSHSIENNQNLYEMINKNITFKNDQDSSDSSSETSSDSRSDSKASSSDSGSDHSQFSSRDEASRLYQSLTSLDETTTTTLLDMIKQNLQPQDLLNFYKIEQTFQTLCKKSNPFVFVEHEQPVIQKNGTNRKKRNHDEIEFEEDFEFKPQLQNQSHSNQDDSTFQMTNHDEEQQPPTKRCRLVDISKDVVKVSIGFGLGIVSTVMGLSALGAALDV
ncbi:hypothetical protein OIO90_001228 [Microbotryomycetes sp. JL221]|nr:hypothetical protein OIO90_001228 [Microbotryomycetes sp. JL221]